MNQVAAKLLLAVSLCASAQVPLDKKVADEAHVKAKAATEGLQLPVTITVRGNVSVEAVLLPPSTTRGLFGRAVADRYAAIQLIISNHSQEAAMVLQSVFIDYSRWLLSGSSGDKQDSPCPSKLEAGQVAVPDCPNRVESYEAESKSNQIASAEYRIPRGQLLDAQPWTVRNLAVRILEASGTIASGYGFAFHELGVAKGISSYNGNFLPALRYVLPDPTIEQLNRISDLGFRVNTVVPRESSSIVIAFFPLDRFLPPGLKKIYLKSPAIFFVPHAAILDPVSLKLLKPILDGNGIDLNNLRKDLLTAMTNQKTNPETMILNRLSLNRVRVLVGGSMTLDQDTVAASIEDIKFDDGDDAVNFWTEAGDKTATVSGRYLAGGKVAIDEADKLGITEVATLPESASDQTLHFKFKLTKAIPAKQKLTFRVNKVDKNQKPIVGIAREWIVPEYLMTTPEIQKVERSGTMLTITGKRFNNTTENPLRITLRPGSVAGVEPVPIKTFDRTPTEIKIDLAPLNLKAACWTPEVTVGAMASVGSKSFAQPPVPKITSAKKSSTRIVVNGEGFVDLEACGKPLRFQLLDQKDGATPFAASNVSINSPTQATMDFPAVPAGNKWRVRILLDGVEAATQPVE